MKRLPGMPMPRGQMAAMMEKKRAAAGGMPTPPVAHVSSMMQGPMHSYMGRFQAPNILQAGHNTTKWIQGANIQKGEFTRKAKAAGMGVQAYAAKVTKPGSTASTELKREGNLAKTFKKMARGK